MSSVLLSFIGITFIYDLFNRLQDVFWDFAEEVFFGSAWKGPEKKHYEEHCKEPSKKETGKLKV